MIGKVSSNYIDMVLETIPLEISILDKDDKVMAWNKHSSRIFKRPEAVVGRDVRNCHPKRSIGKVEQIIEEMKAGKREKARFWIDLKIHENEPPHKVLIEYFALRDTNGKYMGCLEASQDISDKQKITGEQRLLDE
ncbi:MAG: PAS domain-containing protein [Thermoplasmatota archaeon]|jgi:PAS domain S-box-containing protein